MKKPFQYTRVTVKLRTSKKPNEWYLQLEAYPVFKAREKKPIRIVESLNRSISSPLWDSVGCTRSGKHKAKRDRNGIILCRTEQDQEACIFADNVRKMRQHEYDMAALYPAREKEKQVQEERGKQDFIDYFDKITYSHHPNSSESIIENWERASRFLRLFSENKPIPFSTINVKWAEDLKLFLLQAPQGGFKKGTISQTTASTYFAIIKAGLKQAFVDEYLSTDVSEKVKGIPAKNKQRQTLTLEEVNKLVETPCKKEVLKRAFLFSVLTGMRHCDIQQLKWGQIVNMNGKWQIEFTQQKTSEANYLPISEQALILCGERQTYNHLVFAGLQDASWINRPLAEWVKAAGITKHITFHCARHSFATLQLTNGTDIYTVSRMLGHTNVRTTQIYAKVVDEKKEEAANAIQIKGIDSKKA